MSGVAPVALKDLAKDTPPSEIKQRKLLRKNRQTNQMEPVFRDGKPMMLDYVDARYVQDTLDEVVGPENWQAIFEDVPGGVRCTLSILVDHSATGDGRWVSKSDVGVPSTIEPVKGAHSDAFKRAAVHWGIARDLYEDREGRDREEVMANEPQPQSREPGTVRQQVGAARAQRYAQNEPPPEDYGDPEDDGPGDEPAWLCPIHGTVKIVPAGTSKKPPYRSYPAFYACPERDCNEKGPRVEP